jgi:hypothetical protein
MNALQAEEFVDPKKGLVMNLIPHANGRASVELHGAPPKLATQIQKLVHAAATKPRAKARKTSTKKQGA